MACSRRHFVQLIAGAATIHCGSTTGWCQTYPSQPVRIIVGFGPGGASDILARLIGQRLTERLGRPFIVENRPGAASNIAAEAVVRAPPDGYTLLVMTSGNAMNASIYQNLGFDLSRDIAPVATLAFNPGVMEVRPSFPASSVPEFIAYAKSNPGKVTMATSGSGSPPHVWGEMFKMMSDVDLIPVPYRGGSGPALADLMGGQVDVTFDPLASSIELIKAGKIKPLAVTSSQRSKMLPQVPAIGEFVAGYDAGAWIGLGAPKSTPPEIVRRLNAEINAALSDPTMRARFEELGTSVLVTSPSEFAEIIVRDIEKWSSVVHAAKIKVD